MIIKDLILNKLRLFYIGGVLSILLVLLTGCELATAFGEIFDEDETTLGEISYYNQDGSTYNYSYLNLDVQSFLYENVFINSNKIIQDSLNIFSSQSQREYFYYFNNDANKSYYKPGNILDNKEHDGYDYSEPYSKVGVVINPSFFTISTQQLPDHKSNYFFNNVPSDSDTCQGDLVYCSNMLGDGGFSDGVKLVSNNRQINFPKVATVAVTPTSLDDYAFIGVARNGVLLSQNVNGLSYDDISHKLDEYYGLPEVNNGYRYLFEPPYFTGYVDDTYFTGYDYTNFESANRSSLIGIALDGFPIYGPYEYNRGLEPTDLDQCRGHIGETGDNFTNHYHYHVKPIERIISGDEENLFIECFSGSVQSTYEIK